MIDKDAAMKMRYCLTLAVFYGLLHAAAGIAQTAVSEDFTGASTVNSWYYSGGACLTAGNTAGTGTEFTFTTSGTAGQIPGCTYIVNNSDAYSGEALVGGYNGTFPDPATAPNGPSGALRFTNGCISSGCGSGGYNQFGAIVSGSTFGSTSGVQVTFKTVTYRGDSGGSGSDGADGISFFLMDGSVAPNVGSYGGSLAYTCSLNNSKYGYNGMIGGYIGLGIDEYGNYLNGTSNTLGETVNYTNGPDNTASGGTYQPNRIGMRGAGNVNWTWLNANYPSYYPTSLSTSNRNSAVQNTCKTGTLWNYGSGGGVDTGTTVADYAAIPNAYKVLSGVTIANEYSTGGLLRSNATPILYKLKITSGGLLSLSYSYNGGAYQSVLTNQNITSSNGALPTSLRFGFAGSTGGSSNIHEVLCFKAAPADTAASSAASNQTQSSRVTSSTQAYFAYYDPNDWTGRLTANQVSSDSSGNLSVATTAYWDAACVLTGVASGSKCANTGVSGPTAAEGATNRVILSYNGTQGVPFEYSATPSTTTLSATEQTDINFGETIAGLLLPASTVNYLRGDQSLEINAAGSLFFRDRDFVLGDIVDSSPVAVGQPVSPYTLTWQDKLNTSATMPENNSTTQSYSTFVTNNITRENMVYVGANDGMLHGFRAGAFDSTNTFVGPSVSGNTDDGKELLAYFPMSTITGASLSSAAGNASGTNNCLSTSVTSTTAQSIRGFTPVDGSAVACTQPTLDYANYQYGHNFFVDATPGTGDLFYGSSPTAASWHTWLVGGLGAGGAGIYALDITNPANFTEANAASVVIGEWNTSNITCSNSTTCASSLGNTYGTPIIRRLHNGTWGIIWGNGFGSSSGDAGIFILTINPTTAAKTMYYLSTGKSSTTNPDGIGYVTSADLDGDHITDYVYAGDLLGNVWRFDLTSNSASSWGVSSPDGGTTPQPIFAAGATHPITSSLVVAVVNGNLTGTQLMIAFGTGKKTPLTNTTSTTYVSGTQHMYAFWDWNMANWNSLSATSQYASLAGSATGLSSPYTMAPSNLTTQTLAVQTTGLVDLTSSTICWKSTSTCTGSNTSFGWKAALPSTNEQVVFNPQLVGGAFNINTTVPASNSLLSCTSSNDTGYTYLIQLATGGVASAANGNTNIFINTTTYNASTSTTSTTVADANAAGLQTNATGTSMQMSTATNQASGTINSAGTGSSTSCPLGSGACTNLNSVSGLVMYPSPFANVTGCASGETYLVYTTTSAGIAATRIAPSCPLTGQRTTRSVFR